MSNLRNKLIRLAHQKPELRKDLLPLLTEKKAGGNIQKLLQPPKGLRDPSQWDTIVDYLETSLVMLGDWNITSRDNKLFDFKKNGIEMTLDLSLLASPKSEAAIRSFLKLKDKVAFAIMTAAQDSYGDMFYSTIYDITKKIVGRSAGAQIAHKFAIGVAEAQGIKVVS